MRDETWGWNVEMQLKAWQRGLRIEEIGIDYKARRYGRSKISGSVIGTVRAGTRILYSVGRYYDWRARRRPGPS
jgi:hypothetical protein